MKLTEDVKNLSEETTTKFCPYRGEYDWQIECIEARCMKFDPITKQCGRG